LNAGWRNGATEAQFDTPAFTTPDPNKFSFSSSKTIATGKGGLKGRRVYVFDVVSGFGMDLTDIDSKASTGVFAGATGVVHVHILNKSVTVDIGPYYQEIAALVCFPPGHEAPDR